MASYTGQAAKWNGFKGQVGAWIDWVVARREDFSKRTPEQQATIIMSGEDPILTMAYWLYKNVLRSMFANVPDTTDSSNPLETTGGSPNKGKSTVSEGVANGGA